MSSTAKQFEFVLNFASKISYDKKQVDKTVKDIQTLFNNNDFELGIDEAQFKKEFSKIAEYIDQINQNAQELDVNIDVESLLKDFDKVSAELEDILGADFENLFKNINVDDLQNSITQIQKAVDEIDLNDLQNKFDSIDPIKALGKQLQEDVANAESELKDLGLALVALKQSGKEGTPEFDKLESQFSKAKEKADDLKNAVAEVFSGDVTANAESFADTFLKFEALNEVASKIGDFADQGTELRDTISNISAQTGLVGKELDDLVGRSEKAFINGMGENIAEATKAMGSAQQLLGNFLSPEDVEKFATRAAAIGQVFDKDVVEVIGGARTFIAQFGLDADRAGDLLALGMQKGGSKMDDLLDTLDEYSQLTVKAGFNAEEFVGILTTGMEKGARDTDKLADAIKETQIRLSAGDTRAAIASITSPISASILETVKLGEQGKLSVKEVMQTSAEQIKEAFDSGKISATVRDQLAGALSGTMAEDIGGQLYTEIFSTKIDSSVVTAEAKKAGEQIQGALGSVTVFEKVERQFDLFATKASTLLSPVLGGLSNVASTATSVAPGIAAMNNVIKDLPVAKMQEMGKSALGVAKNFGSLKGLESNFAGIKSGVNGLSGQMSKLGPLLTNPFVLAGVGLTLFLTQTEKGQEILGKMGDKGAELLEKLKPVGEFLKVGFGSVLEGTGELIFEFFDAAISNGEALFEIFSELGQALGIFQSGTTGVEGFGDALDTTQSSIKTFFDLLIMIPRGFALIFDGITGLVRNAPEVIDAFSEYIQAKLNPASWWGDTDAEKQAEAKLSGVLDNAMSKAKGKIASFKLGEALDKSLESKKKISKAEELDKLVKEFQNAGDEVKRADIGAKIAELAPDAVNGYKQIVNANNEVVQAVDINIAKADEYAKKQKELGQADLTANAKDFSKTLQDQANDYEKLAVKSEEIKKKIIEDSAKGIDTTATVKQFNDLQKDLKDKGKVINDSLKEASKVGIEVTGVKLGDNTQAQFSDQLNKVVKSTSIKQATDGLNEALKLKGDLDSGNSLGKLQEKFKNAKNEAEKESIAKAIAQQAPDAVKSIGTIVDETGRTITQYEIAGDKVEEYASKTESAIKDKILKAQQKVQEGILGESAAYDTLKVDLVKKQKEISEAKSKGLNTKDLEKQYDVLKDKLTTSGESMLNALVKAKEGGVDTQVEYEKVAKSLGKSPEQLKEMVAKQEESRKKAKEQSTAASEIAKAFDEAKASVDGVVNTQISALASINLQLKTRSKDGKKLSDEEIKSLQAQKSEVIKLGREKAKEQKASEKATEQATIAIKGNGKTLLELAQAEFAYRKGLLDNELARFEIAQNTLILSENRKRNSFDDLALAAKAKEIAEKEKEAWIEIYKQKGLIKGINADGIIEFKGKIKKEDQIAMQNEITGLVKTIQDNTLKKNELEVKVKLDQKEINKLIKAVEDIQLQAELELGIVAPQDVFKKTIDSINREKNTLQKELDEVNKQVAAYQKQSNEDLTKVDTEGYKTALAKQAELKKAELDLTKRNNDTIKAEYERQVGNIRDSEAQKLNVIQGSLDKQLAELDSYLNTYNSVAQSNADKNLADRLTKYEEEQANELKVLDKYKELGQLSEDEYKRRSEASAAASAERKAKTEEEFANKALVLQGIAEGAKLQQQADAEAKKAKIQIDARNAELEIFKSSIKIGDDKFSQLLELQKKFNSDNQAYLSDSTNAQKLAQKEKSAVDLLAFQNSIALNAEQRKAFEESVNGLDTAQKIFDEKGSLLRTLGNELANDVQGAISGLFAGDGTKAIVDNARKLFSTIVGAIQKQIDLFILKLLFSEGVATFVAPLPPFLQPAAILGIKTLLSSGVKALTDPILQPILAFPTGGIIDKPTLMIAGDGAKLGAPNREYVLNDPQFRATVEMAASTGNKVLENRIDALYSMLSGQQLEAVVSGTDLRVLLKRVENQRALVSR